MPTITSSGAGSGLDINTLVRQLVAAERAPYDVRIGRAEARVTSEFSAMAQLKGAMSSLQAALGGLKKSEDFQVRSVTLESRDYFEANASSAAAAGTYGVEVRQLAHVAQLGSAAVTGGATGVVGTGTLTIAMGAASFSVSMVPGSNTLADLRDAINESAQNPGVNAALVNDINGTHLVLAGTQTGAANALRITASGGNGGLNQFVHDPPATTTNMTVLSAAQDAIALIAGFEVHDADNSIDGAIEGVTIELKKAATGTVTNLEVALDGAGIRERANRFVSAYNVLASQVAKLRAYDPATKVAGPLLGDSMLRGIESQMRRLLSDEVAGLGVSPYRTLASLGITSTATGTLELDATKFDAAIKIDPNAASRVFTSESGVSAKLLKLLDAGLADGAELSSRDTRLTAKSKDIVKQKAQLEVRMQQVQARYQRQFNALDSLLTQLQSTSSYLARQLASTSSSG